MPVLLLRGVRGDSAAPHLLQRSAPTRRMRGAGTLAGTRPFLGLAGRASCRRGNDEPGNRVLGGSVRTAMRS